MIDRGALVLAVEPAHTYRGVHRPALDAVATAKRFSALRARYREALLNGDSVIDDLDVAHSLANEARAAGLAVEVVVFEVPQEPAPQKGVLPIAPSPPADELALAGYDVIELLEPWCSALVLRGTTLERNARGLLSRRADAEVLAAEHNAREDTEDPVRAVRVWLAREAM
ncbi:MAG: hypothetical protein JNK05_19045 [Myxococcales bacterium]|nr:hypothetical protein [Myxococcales bacterium]